MKTFFIGLFTVFCSVGVANALVKCVRYPVYVLPFNYDDEALFGVIHSETGAPIKLWGTCSNDIANPGTTIKQLSYDGSNLFYCWCQMFSPAITQFWVKADMTGYGGGADGTDYTYCSQTCAVECVFSYAWNHDFFWAITDLSH